MRKRNLWKRVGVAALAALAVFGVVRPGGVQAQGSWCDERCTSKYGWVHYHWYADGEVEIHEYTGCSGNILYVKCYYA